MCLQQRRNTAARKETAFSLSRLNSEIDINWSCHPGKTQTSARDGRVRGCLVNVKLKTYRPTTGPRLKTAHGRLDFDLLESMPIGTYRNRA